MTAVSCTISQAWLPGQARPGLLIMIKPKLHVYKVGIAKNLFYHLYVEAESEEQAELALGCDAWSKLDLAAIMEEYEDEVYSVVQVTASECSPKDVNIHYSDITG